MFQPITGRLDNMVFEDPFQPKPIYDPIISEAKEIPILFQLEIRKNIYKINIFLFFKLILLSLYVTELFKPELNYFILVLFFSLHPVHHVHINQQVIITEASL